MNEGTTPIQPMNDARVAAIALAWPAARVRDRAAPAHPVSRRQVRTMALWVALSAAGCFAFLLGCGGTDQQPQTTRQAADVQASQDSLQLAISTAESILVSVSTDQVAALPDSALLSLVTYGQRGDSTKLRLVEQERQKRRAALDEQARRDRAPRLVARAKEFRFDNGSRCTRVTPARVKRLAEAHADWSDDALLSIACGGIGIGYTGEQVEASWGRPSDINRTVSASGTREQWVYGEYSRRYVYLDDGVVTAIQD